jgi:hypothetical protein
MKKEIKNGQGFICKDLEEKKRIWEKLIQHRYPMFADGNDPCYKHIMWEDGEFVEANQKNIQPLNEAEFFGETEWTPKPGDWVEVSDDGAWLDKPRQYLCTIDGVHLVVASGSDYENQTAFSPWKHIRKHKPETMTLEEVRKALNKPTLIIEPW